MTIYYVRPINGLNTNAGTSFATAFATTQKALDSVAAGDTVRLCPEAVETTAVQIDLDTTIGSVTGQIVFEPGNVTDGARDMSLTYTIQATASMSSLLNCVGAFSKYYSFFHIIFDANSNATYGVANIAADGADDVVFTNCRFTGAISHGVFVRGVTWFFYGCEIDHNGGHGYTVSVANRGSIRFYGGSSHHNAGDGIYVNANTTTLIGVAIYRNTGCGINMTSNCTDSQFHGCTIYGNTLDGIRMYSSAARYGLMYTNNSFVSNGGYGIKTQLAVPYNIRALTHNHFYNNTSGQWDEAGDPGTHYIVGDPLFMGLIDGSEDFHLTSGSPLLAAGWYGSDIGALGLADVGGGGAAILNTLHGIDAGLSL